MDGVKSVAVSQRIKQTTGNLSVVQVMPDSRLRQKRAGEQALYAVTARRFLEVARYYLDLQYIGSRHWHPNGRIFSGSSAVCRHPDRISEQGESYVVG
jgi:hypothetical protein